MSAEDLDRLLAPYEARTVALSRDEIAERKRGMAFGADLNRLQGIVPASIDRRLENLWCLGQVTREELAHLVSEIAHKGLFRETPKEISMDGR